MSKDNFLRVVGPEEWKPVPEYIGYEVSNLGRVRSYRSINGRGALKKEPRLLNPTPVAGKPYLKVALCTGDGKSSHIKVHILVLLAFVGPRPSEEHDGCHNDGDARNNVLTNLRWDTKQSNADDRSAHGTQVKGESVALAVLTEDQVKEIKAAIPVWKKGMGRQFAQKFGVGDSAISAIKKGHTWNHIQIS